MTIATPVSLGTATNSSGSSISITITNNVNAGDVIFIIVSEDTSTTSAASYTQVPTDTASNTYLQISALNNNAAISSGVAAIHYVKHASAMTSGVGVISFNKSGTHICAITAIAITGCDPNPFDASGFNSGTGSSATPSLTSNTPSEANEMFIAALAGVWGDGNLFTQDAVNGWAFPPDKAALASAGRAAAVGGYYLNSTASTRTYNPSWDSSRAYSIWIVPFLPGFNPAVFPHLTKEPPLFVKRRMVPY